MNLSNSIEVISLGQVDYVAALQLQKKMQLHRLAHEIADTLMFLEHPPVITKGKQDCEQDFLQTKTFCEEQGVAIQEAGRGGRLTYHGPGQLVVYFIFSLRDRNLSVPQFVAKVEQAIILMLTQFHLQGKIIPDFPGVFIENRKIASLGFALHKGVSMHGIAINISNDLTPFSWINPCGMGAQYSLTSMAKELVNYPTLDEVQSILSELLVNQFE